MTYPIAEIFTSVQGEGAWTGTRMIFIRLAGCTVGKPYPKYESLGRPSGLEVYQEKCTLWDGREFPCDTNYKKISSMSIEELLHCVKDEERVCLTGGEPMMHDVLPLLQAWSDANKMIHLETSGTIELSGVREHVYWIAISPKKGVLKSALMKADEVKVLVDEQFDLLTFEHDILDVVRAGKIWFQPVNKLHTISDENLARCLALQAKYKGIRISVQMHKWMGVQ